MSLSHTLSLIGNTPLFEITQFDTGLCRLFVKLELQNPGGSIKDRIALSMIEAAEQSGVIKPGDTIIEATAGNTGIALALVAKLKGYQIKIVIPDKMSREKVQHLEALDAKVIITRSDVYKGHPEYFQDLAARIAKETGAYYIDQFSNQANPLAHELTTGPEIWQQMGEQVDAVVCGVGSGGTLTGLGRYFSRVSPETKIILADPVGSVIADLVNSGSLVKPGPWLIEGIGEDFVPPVCELNYAYKAYAISDKTAVDMTQALLKKEGILAGSSSGALLAAALQYCQAQNQAQRVVTFICDTGNKYLSKVFNTQWLEEKQLSPVN